MANTFLHASQATGLSRVSELEAQIIISLANMVIKKRCICLD